MTKKVIAIISVLKPVDDSRNFEKIAATIGNTNKYEINIIGFSAKKIPVYPNIVFHPIFSFQRLSLRRFLAPLKIFRLLLQLKPDLIIVTCVELLTVAVIIKLISGAKIVYDVQENYFRNIAYSGSYPFMVKYPLAIIVRSIEYFSSFFICSTIFAEKIYVKQLQFLSSESMVFENKAAIPQSILEIQAKRQSSIVFLYSGTIAVHYGIFDTIELVKELRKSINNLELKIVGYAARSSVRNQLVEITRDLDFVHISAIDALIPHEQILQEMKNANFCILPYEKNKSTEGRIPTKLFECLAMEIPVIVNSNESWNTLVAENNAGIIYDFKTRGPFPTERLSDKYYGKSRSQLYRWDGYVTIFTSYIDKLFI